METKDRFRELIRASTLDANSQDLWLIFIDKATDEENEAVLEAVNESEDNLKLLTKYLRDKILDMQS
jgi:hypothetical protein